MSTRYQRFAKERLRRKKVGKHRGLMASLDAWQPHPRSRLRGLFQGLRTWHTIETRRNMNRGWHLKHGIRNKRRF